MAITVQQSPTYFNIANNHLVYVVTSDQTSQPQYQFVLDIKDKDGNLVQRLKQQPNPSNKGVFDIGHLISSQFGGDYTPLSIDESLGGQVNKIVSSYRSGSNALPASVYYTYPWLNNGNAQQFDVFIGEEYGTSTTSVVTLYDGEGGAGNPAVRPTKEWQIYSDGVLDTNTRYPSWSPGWNLTSQYDTYYTSSTFTSGSIEYQLWHLAGKAKWAPQNWYGQTYFEGVDYTGFNYQNPSLPLYQFNVGLTDFPVTRSVQWDDYLTLSFFQGTEYAPDQLNNIAPQSGSLYMPRQQWISYVNAKFLRTDGTSTEVDSYGDVGLRFRIDSSSVVTPENNDPLLWMHSQSVDDTMVHFGVGPMNFSFDEDDGQDIRLRDPINYPDAYTKAFQIKAYAPINANASSYTNMELAGRERTGYLAPEIGDTAYTVPLTILSDAGNPTVSYSIPTSEFVIRANTGGECIARIDFADIIYTPESPFPATSVLAMQDCINRDMIASGSSARAFLTEATQEEIDGVAQAFKDYHDEKYWKWKLVVSNGPGRTGGGYIMVLDPETNPSADHLGASLIGDDSCTGLATGLFTAQNGSSLLTATLGGVAGDSYYEGFDGQRFESLWENRYYEIDWSTYPGHYDNCGYEKKQFYWVNKYGAYDYFTFTLAETITDNIERKDYKQTFVDFASSTNNIDYTTARRGKKQFQNKPTQTHRVESNWLTQEEADAVREMFFSTQVYYLDKQIKANLDYNFKSTDTGVPRAENLTGQRMGTSTNGTFDQIQELPVVIINATLTEKTNPRTDKLYRYTVEYQLANELNSRV